MRLWVKYYMKKKNLLDLQYSLRNSNFSGKNWLDKQTTNNNNNNNFFFFDLIINGDLRKLRPPNKVSPIVSTPDIMASNRGLAFKSAKKSGFFLVLKWKKPAALFVELFDDPKSHKSDKSPPKVPMISPSNHRNDNDNDNGSMPTSTSLW